MLKPILISPPFGHYHVCSRATSVLGSFTVARRLGRLPKILQFVVDNLRHPVPGGYRNRIGLKNPGVLALGPLWQDCIYSFVGLEDYDWETLLRILDALERETLAVGQAMPFIEINLGCPNVHEYSIRQATLEQYCRDYKVIAKLPPTEKLDHLLDMCAQAGIKYVHLSNTLPSELGGISGYPLKEVNLPLVEKTHRNYPDMIIIGGGGIYTYEDLLEYRAAGATYFSSSTVWLKPWKGFKLIRDFYREQEETSDASANRSEPEARVRQDSLVH